MKHKRLLNLQFPMFQVIRETQHLLLNFDLSPVRLFLIKELISWRMVKTI